MSRSPRRVSIEEAADLIQHYNLFTVRGAWHYSWHLEHFYDEVFVYERNDKIYLFHDTPIHRWAPGPLFSNDHSLDEVTAAKGKDCPFWFLKMTTFDAFLDRRSAISRNPRKSFPSRESYPRVAQRLGCHLRRFALFQEQNRFIQWYDNLKDPKYQHSGTKCVADAIKDNVRVPREWFIFYALIEDRTEVCKCVALMIEDERSCSKINIATERRNCAGINNGGYGVLLDVEVIKTLCERGYYSCDSGVSGRYGSSKDVIFLDTLLTNNSARMSFLT